MPGEREDLRTYVPGEADDARVDVLENIGIVERLDLRTAGGRVERDYSGSVVARGDQAPCHGYRDVVLVLVLHLLQLVPLIPARHPRGLSKGKVEMNINAGFKDGI